MKGFWITWFFKMWIYYTWILILLLWTWYSEFMQFEKMVKICNLAQTVDTMKQKPYPLITHIRHKVHMGLEAVQFFFFCEVKINWSMIFFIYRMYCRTWSPRGHSYSRFWPQPETSRVRGSVRRTRGGSGTGVREDGMKD